MRKQDLQDQIDVLATRIESLARAFNVLEEALTETVVDEQDEIEIPAAPKKKTKKATGTTE